MDLVSQPEGQVKLSHFILFMYLCVICGVFGVLINSLGLEKLDHVKYN